MFFKYSLNKILLTTVLITAFFIAGNVFAEATKIVFTTDSQSIGSGQVSGPITIQLQDISGIEQKALETTYINISSSNTGEISSSKDFWKIFSTLPSDFSTSSIYISSNSANRTFYYKGLVSGEHNITVIAKSKSGKIFDSISQIISVDVGTTTDTVATTTQSTSTLGTSTTTNTQIITKTVVKYVSTHSNPEDLSEYSGTSKFEISAGRERVGYIGAPIKFSAKNNLSKNSSCSYTWVYGDGSKDVGQNVSHSYKFSGEYNIVLNGSCGEDSAVSRTKVKILKPEINFNLIPSGDLDISNVGRMEINMGGWIIQSSSTKFVFPEDTIISAGGKIVLSKEYLNMIITKGGTISLVDPSDKVVVVLESHTKNIQTPVSSSTESLSIKVSKEEADNFKNAFLRNSKEKFPKLTLDVVMPQKSSEIATVLESVKNKETKGFWKELLGLPAKGIKAVARVFYDIE